MRHMGWAHSRTHRLLLRLALFGLGACGSGERYDLGQTRSHRERSNEPNEGFYTGKEAFIGS